MSYVVLARKYRPQNFLELYAQDHVTTIIKNALESNRIAHAYLFSGPRGVGKTSLARILAKSLNCEQGPTINPCNVCSNCKEITSGTASDVIEIDGASNTGVDDIRELQRELLYAPSQSKYKIYIIDEVHMLSKSAFNALLKTLEEPPENVIFIFATTEAHKVIPTIISRCQRFDFKRIPMEAIVKRLQEITTWEKITIDSESLYLIARKADGGMRDALSLLDQVLSYCSGEVSISKVRSIFGVLPSQTYQALLDKVIAKDSSGIISQLHAIIEEGIDLVEFINNFMEFCRIVLLTKIGAITPEINPDELSMYQELAPKLKINSLMYIMSMLIQTRNEMRSSSNPFLILEVAMIKLSKMDEMDDLEELIAKLGKGQFSSATVLSDKTLKQQTPAPNPSPAKEIPVPEPIVQNLDEHSLKANWQRISTRLRKESSMAGLAFANATLLSIENNNIKLKADSQTSHGMLKKFEPSITKTIKEIFAKSVVIALEEPESIPQTHKPQRNINEILEEFPQIKELAETLNMSISPLR